MKSEENSEIVETNDSNFEKLFCLQLTVPTSKTGVIIGTSGRNCKHLKENYCAKMDIFSSEIDPRAMLLRITCPQKHKLDVIEFINDILKRKTPDTIIANPQRLRVCYVKLLCSFTSLFYIRGVLNLAKGPT